MGLSEKELNKDGLAYNSGRGLGDLGIGYKTKQGGVYWGSRDVAGRVIMYVDSSEGVAWVAQMDENGLAVLIDLKTYIINVRRQRLKKSLRESNVSMPEVDQRMRAVQFRCHRLRPPTFGKFFFSFGY